jgi:hypothetical protein
MPELALHCQDISCTGGTWAQTDANARFSGVSTRANEAGRIPAHNEHSKVQDVGRPPNFRWDGALWSRRKKDYEPAVRRLS